MRRLLFLIADTGGGHRAAATAVERQMATEFPGDFEVTILDPFTSAKPKVIGGTAGLYGPITRRARWLWGGLYHSTNSRSAVALLETTVLRSVTNAVSEAIERIDPDGVVSFHPLLNHISVRAVRSRARTIPVITVITDLVDIHVAWTAPDVDAVVIPSPGALDQCRRAGIPASRCHDFGLAVDRRFTELPSDPAGIARIRERLGLRNDAFVVLVCGGADGSGGLVKHARAIAAGASDVDVVVICGRNERARAALAGLHTSRGRAVRVLGYVNNMPEWMRASDVVVSKAGPGRSPRRSAAACRCSSSGICPVRSAVTWSGWWTSERGGMSLGTISSWTRLTSWPLQGRRRSPPCAPLFRQPRDPTPRGASPS